MMKVSNILRNAVMVALAAMTALSCKKDSPSVIITPTEDKVGAPVFYEANPKLFASTKALAAVEGRLDEIRALGTDVLWLMPIFPVGSKNSVNSPYCTRDYTSVNPSFGTLDDLKSLVSAAHSKGMKVILDIACNHTAWDHPWITEHPDWYTHDSAGNIISPAGTNWTDVADLNYDNKSMRAAMLDALLWWPKNAGIDGYRFDAVSYVPYDFWSDVTTALKAYDSDAVLLAEVSDPKCFGYGFDYAYGWSYQSALKSLFAGGSVSDFYSALTNENSSATGDGRWMRFITNHDMASESSPVSVYKSAAGALAAFVITAFAGDSPMIYSSQEIGYAKALSFFSYNIMDWSSNSSYTAAYKAVMAARSECGAYLDGAPRMYTTGKLVSLWWEDSGHGVFVVVNPTAAQQSATAPMERRGESVTDMLTGSSTTVPTTLTLGAYEYRIYKK